MRDKQWTQYFKFRSSGGRRWDRIVHDLRMRQANTAVLRPPCDRLG